MIQMMEGALVGRNIIDITHPGDRGDTEVDMRRLRDEARDFTIRKRYVRPDGSVVWAQAQASIVTVDDVKAIAGLILPSSPDPLLEHRRARDIAIFRSLAQLGEARSKQDWPDDDILRWRPNTLG